MSQPDQSDDAVEQEAADNNRKMWTTRAVATILVLCPQVQAADTRADQTRRCCAPRWTTVCGSSSSAIRWPRW